MEEEGDSYTEEEGTIEGMGSSIWGGGGESVLSEQEGLARRLFRLLHRRRHPSRRGRPYMRRPQGAVRFSAQHWRSAGASGKSYQGGVTEGRLNASALPASGPPGTRVAVKISLIQNRSDFKRGQPLEGGCPADKSFFLNHFPLA